MRDDRPRDGDILKLDGLLTLITLDEPADIEVRVIFWTPPVYLFPQRELVKSERFLM